MKEQKHREAQKEMNKMKDNIWKFGAKYVSLK